MNTLSIATINGQNILMIAEEEGTYIPIKPICEALGVSMQGQLEKIKSHPILGSTIKNIFTVAGDNRNREMICLPLQFIYGWLFTIQPDRARSEYRDNIIKYQEECYRVLYNHFWLKTQQIERINEIETQTLSEIDMLLEKKKECEIMLREKKKTLEELREKRLDPQCSLFD